MLLHKKKTDIPIYFGLPTATVALHGDSNRTIHIYQHIALN